MQLIKDQYLANFETDLPSVQEEIHLLSNQEAQLTQERGSYSDVLERNAMVREFSYNQSNIYFNSYNTSELMAPKALHVGMGWPLNC